MAKVLIPENMKSELLEFLQQQRNPELVNTYLFYLQKKFDIHPIVFPRDKIIYQSLDAATKALEAENKLWRETEIQVHIGDPSVNDKTRKIYICPFTGKVFGNNTHPNPQDAIYDWVSKCPENTERAGGLRVKRFFVSEDPEVIGQYIQKATPQKVVSKKVFSSAISGKLFNSKAAVIRDFRENYVKEMALVDVQNQNRFKIDDTFLAFLQEYLDEGKITAFVEAMADHEEFLPVVERWVEADEEDA